MEKIRNIKLFKNYYKEFYVAQTFEVRDKINKVLKLIETQRIRYDRRKEAGNHEIARHSTICSTRNMAHRAHHSVQFLRQRQEHSVWLRH